MDMLSRNKMEKKNVTSDILSMLDQASVFSCGKPIEQNGGSKARKAKDKKIGAKGNNKCAEEKQYASLIGLNDNDDDDDSVYDIDDFLSSEGSRYFNKCDDGNVEEKKKQIRPGFVGRGRILNAQYEKIGGLPSRSTSRSQLHISSYRQEQNDRVISKQLREVIGCGTSNEEIEDAFAKKFKTSADELPEENINNSKGDSSDSSIATSSSSQKASLRKSIKQVHIPLALGLNNVDNDISLKTGEVFVEGKCSNNFSRGEFLKRDNNIVSNSDKSTCSVLSPIKFYALSEEYRASKLPSIYDNDDLDNFISSGHNLIKGSVKGDDLINANDSDDEDVTVIEIEENFLTKKQQIEFRTRDSYKSSVSGYGRNALINGLLKKELCRETNEVVTTRQGQVDRDFVRGDVDSCSALNERAKSSLDSSCSIISNSCISPDVIPGVDLDPGNTTLKKTYIESILHDKSKLGFTKPSGLVLGDYLTSNSVSISSCNRKSSKKYSRLNPDAPIFKPDSFFNKNSINDFRLNNNDFPPL